MRFETKPYCGSKTLDLVFSTVIDTKYREFMKLL